MQRWFLSTHLICPAVCAQLSLVTRRRWACAALLYSDTFGSRADRSSCRDRHHRDRANRRHAQVTRVGDAFGPSRLIFGSDWPVSTLARNDMKSQVYVRERGTVARS